MMPADQADRVRAVTDFSVNLLLEAGAGTGKTDILTGRFVHWVLLGDGDGGGPETRAGERLGRIVAVTFTEKATTEMTERIEGWLRAVAGGGEKPAAGGALILSEAIDRAVLAGLTTRERVRRRAVEALDRLGTLRIDTIHGFCSGLLSGHASAAGLPEIHLDPDGATADRLFQRGWNRHLAGLDGRQEADLRHLLEDARLSWLRAAVRQIVIRGVDMPRLTLAATPGEMADFARRSGLIDRLDRFGAASRSRGVAAYRELAGLAAGDVVDHGELARLLARPFKEAGEVFVAGRATSAAMGGPVGVKDLGEDVRRLYEMASEIVRAPFWNRFCQVFGPFVERFRHDLLTQGVISFDDLLRVATRLLESDLAVRLSIAGSIDHLLIDEFQDTDPLQVRIARAVCGCQDGRLRPGSLFVVGDPKQSIYGFRGADLSAYESMQTAIEESGGCRLRLSANFRSSEPLVRFVNAVFEPAMHFAPGLQSQYEPIESGTGREGAPVELWLSDPDRRTSGAEVRRMEVRAVSGWIAREVGAGRRRPGDIAILLRRMTHAAEFAAGLAAVGVPCRLSGGGAFYRRREVIDAINLLTLVFEPWRTICLAGLLLGPVGGLDERGVARLRTAGWLHGWHLAEGGEPDPGQFGRRVARLIRELKRARLAVRCGPVGPAAERLLAAAGMWQACREGADGGQRRSNLEWLLGELYRVEAGGRLALVEWLGRERRAVESGLPAADPQSADRPDAVSVLSVHKAKGLEFPVVFHCELHARPGGGSLSPVGVTSVYSGEGGAAFGLRLGSALRSPGGGRIERLAAEKGGHEELRLAYVVFTRARDRLIVTGRPSGSRIADLLGAGQGVPASIRRLPEVIVEPTTGGGLTSPPVTGETVRALRFPTADGSPAPRLGLITPSELVADPVWEGPRPTTAGIGVEDRGALVGSLCHLLLETIDFRQPLRSLDAGRLALGHVREPAALDEAASVVAGFCKTPGFNLLEGLEPVEREFDFLLAGRSTDDWAACAGRIDLLARDATGRLVVVDYKSDRVEPGGETARAARYLPQLETYRRAVRSGLDLSYDPRLLVVFLRTGVVIEL